MSNVLILSNNALSSSRNNGKTLASLFSNLKGVTLSQLYLRDELPDVSLACRYFKISEREILKSFFVNTGAEVANNIDFKRERSFSCSKPNPIFSKFSRFRDVTLVKWLRDFIWLCGTFRNRRLASWLSSIQPDVIFFVAGGGIFSYRLALKLAKERGIPLIVYFTDDYFIYPQGGILFRFYQARLRAFAKEVVSYASSRFAIGESMANEYHELFGEKFSWIMNCSSFEKISPAVFSSEDVQISYFGGLHFQRWKALSKLGEVLKSLRGRGFLSRLNVYSASSVTAEMQDAFQRTGICFKGSVFGEDLLREVEAAHVLVHVECDDPVVLQNTRLSVSTKIPEYLSSGRLVLGFGPPNVASLALLKKYSLGLIVDSSLPVSCIEEALLGLWNKTVLDESLGLARRFMKTTLNVDEMRKRLLRSIERARGENGGAL